MHAQKKRFFLVLGLLLIVILGLAACEPEEVEVTRIVETTVEVEVPGPEVQVEVPGPEVEVTRVVEVMLEPDIPTIPFEELWAGSAHNAAEDESFAHWNEDDPAEVPPACARCHSTPGYIDWVGADGTEAGLVDAPAPIGTTIECAACHNDATIQMTSVVFPSGVEVTGLGDESRCMQCHQGRHSTVSVNQSIADAGLTDEDTISEDLGFSNIHYYAAAATLYGTVTKGGYEYEGKSYDSKNDHVAGYDTCIGCHNPHTLKVRIDECSQCHTNVSSEEDLVNIRMPGSLVDYDGDGDIEEGVYFEIESLRDLLLQGMQAYASEVGGTGIVYDAGSYPYFFLDTDGDGVASEAEVASGNQYNAWTARLAKAAYNYQASLKDPGRFAHGGKYIIQLLYDSLESVNEAVASPIDMTALQRIDFGHFAGSEEAFRHWDEDGEVSASCTKCHSAVGLPLFLDQGVSIAQPTANGLNCGTCHDDLAAFTRRSSEEVTFPSGATVTLEDLDANLCINCHQGRESTVSVNRRIGDAEDDVVVEGLGFVNVHYFAAGATLFGDEVKGAYQYDGKEYIGRFGHVGAFNVCTECHNTHSLQVRVDDCAGCHENVTGPENLHDIRVTEIDFDGDGDMAEGLYGEIETMRDLLLESMNANAAGTEGVDAVVYNANAYPYFFNDAGDRYATWTPRLLRAAYNYQYSLKDPGAFAHNGQYIIQVLYDGLEDMGADVSSMTRP
jgi:hypothetical protein